MGIESPVHLLFIAVVALIVLGPKRLPELARAVGKGIREFRGAMEAAQNEPPGELQSGELQSGEHQPDEREHEHEPDDREPEADEAGERASDAHEAPTAEHAPRG